MTLDETGNVGIRATRPIAPLTTVTGVDDTNRGSKGVNIQE
jgi:hypothetical protein